MRKVRARLGSILLSLAMLLSLLPVTAFAEEVDAYTALKAAVEAAPTNGTQTTVTLTGDITDLTTDQILEIKAGQNIVLNMDGHSITVASDFEGRPFVNYGTFTIQGNGTVDVTNSNTGYGPVNNFGTLTIKNGTFKTNEQANSGAIWNRAGGKAYFNGGTYLGGANIICSAQEAYAEINGGYYENSWYATIENYGEMLITGGTFKNTSCSACDGGHYGYTIRSGLNSDVAHLTIQGKTEDSVQVTGVQGGLAVIGGTADIYNGEYRTVPCEKHPTGTSAFYAGYFTGESYETSTNIYGGTFTSGSKTGILVGNGNPAPDSGAGEKSTVMIYGGTFTGGDANKTAVSVNQTEYAIGAAKIYAGTFSSNVSKYVADGCVLVPQGDQWVVGSLDDLAVAQVGEKKYTNLKSAMDAAQDGETVTLLNDSIGNQQIIITDGRNLTLDMNGYDVGFALKQNISIYHGGLNIIGSGKLYEEAPWLAPVMLYGSDTDLADYSTVTVGKNVTLEGWAGLFIDQHDNHGTTAYGIKVTVYGTLHSVKDTSGAGGHALYVNGTISATEGNVPQITLDGATLNTDLGNGMYLAGYAKTIINNSIIDSSSEDSTGIEIRAGELTINGDTVVKGGTGETDISPNGNGSTTNNVALAVVQHTTKLPTLVTINDGIFIGGAALFEQNAQNNDQEAVSKISLAVNGGSFNGQFYSENKTGFITGGVFSSDPSAYLASGYAAVDNSGDTVYQYKVVPAGQNPAQVVTGDADISVSDSITNADEKALAEEVANALNSDKEPDIGEALKAAAGTVANQNTVTKEQGKDALTNAGVSVTDTSNVTIVVQPYLEVSVANVSIQGSTKTVTLDITPMYITVATTDKNNIQLGATGKNAVQIGDAQELTITKPVTVTIPLTEGFVEDGTLYVKHVKDNGSTYYYKGSVKNNVLTFTNPNGFSLFSYSTSNSVVVADINGQGYASLADAITAVEKGGTIELLADNLSATVSREISFTVTGNGADTVRLSAGSGYKMQQVGNTYTFTYIGTEGGGSSTSGYLVSVDSGKNGKVTVSPQRAEKGETVTITVKPDEGYELDELTVTDKNGDSVKVTYKDDNKYTFKMPGSSVTVEVTFQAMKEESPVDAFLDINTGAWYYDAVKYVVENGLMSGTGTYTFEPNTTLSRGMIAQMLYALEGKPSVSATNSFTDVSANDWYAKAASWAQSKGIITGYDDGRFAPNDPLTREQLALILYNYAQSKGYDTSAKADLSKYVDGSSTSAWAQTAMTWAVGEGLLSGRGLNMLYPTGTATRAEVAQIMMNFCENTAK